MRRNEIIEVMRLLYRCERPKRYRNNEKSITKSSKFQAPQKVEQNCAKMEAKHENYPKVRNKITRKYETKRTKLPKNMKPNEPKLPENTNQNYPKTRSKTKQDYPKIRNKTNQIYPKTRNQTNQN